MILCVAGFNLFKQWSSCESIIRIFTQVHESEVEVLSVGWCYNLFRHNNHIFISGLYTRNETRLHRVTLPSEVSDSDSADDIIVSGNDQYLLLLYRVTQKIWKCNLEKISTSEWIPISSFWNVESSLEQLTVMPHTLTFTDIVAGCTMNMCLSCDGSLYNIPQKISTSHCFGKIIDIQCGYDHAVALTDSGNVYTWGNGRRCQLGHGDLLNASELQRVEALAGVRIVRVRAGGWHSCALSDAGDLYTWGWNNAGQLGIKQPQHCATDGSPPLKKTNTSQYDSVSSLAIPTLVDLYDSLNCTVESLIVDMACGSKHTVIVLNDNSVWATGSNKYGQLGVKTDSLEDLKYFHKVLQTKTKCSVMCGPWTTVIKGTIMLVVKFAEAFATVYKNVAKMANCNII